MSSPHLFVRLFLTLALLVAGAIAQNPPTRYQHGRNQIRGNACVTGIDGSIGQTRCPSVRPSRTARQHSGSGVIPDSAYTTAVSGYVFCNSDYSAANFESDDMSGWSSIDSRPFPLLDPSAPVLDVGCSIPFQAFLGAVQVGSQQTRNIRGGVSVNVSCVVATGVCSASVYGDVTAYSPLFDSQVLLGHITFWGAGSNAQLETYIDPDTGLLNVQAMGADFAVDGRENLADPVPQIYVPLIPVIAPPGSPGFTLTVNGFGFSPQSTVNWNGSPRLTTFVNSSQLTSTISAADISASTTALVTVSSPDSDSLSNEIYFPVTDSTSSIFLAGLDLSVASQPESVVTGDFNQDGKPDLAVASFSGAVSVLNGNGDGTFRGHVDYATGAGARAIVTGDFKGDGKLDLAVANQSSNSISILLGNGDGTFRGHVDYPAGAGPFSLAGGDFNGDGALDLAVVNQSENTVSILAGAGDGTFEFSGSYSTGQLPFGIVVGDFDGSGGLDLAVANYTDGTVSILLGKGDGTFKAHTDYAAGPLPEMLATADLNADGKLDLAVGTNQASADQISILLGNGDGTFRPHNDFPAGSKPRTVTPADFNGNGKIDLAVANYGSSTVSLLLGNGDGTFLSRIDYPTGASPQSITAGDFDGNGRLDLAVANYGSNTAAVLLQTPVVSLSASSLSFGAQEVGITSAPRSLTLTNTGSAPLNVTAISVQADFAQSNTCNTTIQSGSNCDISVTFTPTVSGTRTGVVTIADNAVNSPQTVSLSGMGTIATTTTFSSSLNASKYGQAVTLTAVVVPAQSGAPTGSVIFYDGTTALGSVTLSKGAAHLTVSTLTAGSHSLTASYPGDGTFGPSRSSVLLQTVSRATVSLTLTSSQNPSYVNELVTNTAVVSSSPTIPTGSVSFKQGAAILGTALLVNGQASFTTTFTKAGSVSIVASYSGDQNYLPKNSMALKQVVNKHTSNTSATSSINPSVYGQAINLTSQVTSAAPTQPTGAVTFKSGASSLGTAPLVNGFALLTKKNLLAGTLSITATYNGDTLNNKSTSQTLSQVVGQATTTTTVTSSANPSLVGQNVKFTAMVKSPTVVPVGTVTFTAGTTTLGQVSLAGGKASLTTSALPKGTTTVTATYNGTSNITGSSGSVVQTVK